VFPFSHVRQIQNLASGAVPHKKSSRPLYLLKEKS
jgi:hypothetical protein